MQRNRYAKQRLTIGLAIAGCITLTCGAPQSTLAQTQSTGWNATRPTLNFFGNPGMIDTPTAHAMRDADLSFTLNQFGGSGHTMRRGAVNFQVGTRLSGTFRYVALENFSARDTYMDRGFDVRYLLAEEGRLHPAVTIGLNDMAGTGYYSSEYLVATKTFGRFRTTLGIGWGRLAENNSFDNPLSFISDKFDDRPEQELSGGLSSGELDANHWFRGNAALFGGVQYLATDNLILSLEYSSNSYEFEQENLDFENNTPINLGATWRFDNGIDLTTAYVHGSALSFQLNYVLNPNSLNRLTTGYGDLPPPLTARPAYTAADLGWSVTDAGITQVTDGYLGAALKSQGLELAGFSIEGHKARLVYQNVSYMNEAQALGRAARVLARNAPRDVDTFILEPLTKNGVSSTRVTINRADLEDLEYAPEGAWRSWARADLDSTYDDSLSVIYKPNLNWWASPYAFSSVYDPRDPYRNDDAGIEAGGRFSFAPGWVVSGNAQYRLLSTGAAGNSERLESSASTNIEKVRTGARQYLAATNLAMENLYVSKYFQPHENFYTRGSIGYFEHMYGGISAEVLWAPISSTVALGAELNWVQQREFEGGFGFKDYDVVTGHVSAYLQGKAGMHYQVDAGRYLAGDWGATFKVEREFANGTRIGAFATLTSVSSDDFGEGSFDKGISYQVPLSTLTGKRGKQRIEGNFRPVLGDGGARVNVPGRIYEEVRRTRGGSLQDQWGKVFR